jgi:hypothetical protein
MMGASVGIGGFYFWTDSLILNLLVTYVLGIHLARRCIRLANHGRYYLSDVSYYAAT